MAAAVTVTPPVVQEGKPVVIAMSGFAATHAATISVAQLGLTLNVTTDATGAFTSSAAATIVPQTNVPLDITCSDGTSTVTVHQQVFTE